MDRNTANIDLVFRNGLKDFEVLPPSAVWDGVNPVITKSQKSLITYRIAAFIAVLVISGTLAALFIRNIPSDLQQAAVFPVSLPKPSVQGGNLSSDNVANVSPVAVNILAESNSGQNLPGTTESFSHFELPAPDLNRSFLQSDRQVRNTNQDRETVPESINQVYNPEYSGFSGSAAEKITGSKEVKNSRWEVGAMVSPTYYSRVDLSDNDAAKEIISSEKASFSYTGGLTFAYNVGSRFTIQSGVGYSSIGQRIDGVTSFSGFSKYFDSKGVTGFQVMTSSGTISATNKDLYLFSGGSGARVISMYTRDLFDPSKNELNYISSKLMQNINYVEIPVIMKYKLIDRNIDIRLIGGVSYNILVSNSAYTTSGGTKYYIGKTEGLSPVTVSSSLGMGMVYNLTGNLSLNLEPTLRYYITPLGGLAGSSIHPYSFGVLSGVSFRF